MFSASTGLGDEDQGPFKACSSLFVPVIAALSVSSMFLLTTKRPLMPSCKEVVSILCLWVRYALCVARTVCLHWVLSHGRVSGRWVPYGQVPRLRHSARGMSGWAARSEQLASDSCVALSGHLCSCSAPCYALGAPSHPHLCSRGVAKG